MDWPICYGHNLCIGNPDSNIGVCTLWTEKEQLKIPKEHYAVMGNLYSKKGITYLIRNTLANPKIRYIVIFGQDIAESGKQLIELYEGTSAGIGISKEHLEIFKKQIELIDLRNKPFEELVEILKKLNAEKKEPFGKPIIIEDTIDVIGELPNENANFVAREKQIADAWPKILDLIMKFGEIKETQYGMKEKEILNTIVVIEDEIQELKPILHISRKQLIEYLPTVMSSNKPVGLSYTYGERLFSYKVKEYDDIDQIQNIISQLKETPYTRRAVAMTWNVEKDRNSKHPPCLIYHHFIVRHGKLFLTAVIRSNDMFKAWPLNAMALNELLRFVSEETGIPYGGLTVISNSAHVYETDWEEVQKIVSSKQSKELVLDPRGYFVIYIKDEKINADHFTNDNNKSAYFFNGTNATEIYKQIINENLVSREDHGAYLGKELARAEECLRNKKEYRQDSV